jgi:3-methyladenine DNA glycosylase AlkD
MPPDPSIRALLAHIRGRHRALGQPERAVAERAYLKSQLDFHGVSMPEVRATAAALLKDNPGLDHDQLLALVQALYATSYHDLHSAGVALLERRRRTLAPADLPLLIDLVRRSANWAHVDWLATKVVGAVIAQLPAKARAAQIRRWAADPDMWVRRTALLAELDVLRAGGGDFALLAAIAVPMLPEKEFFIRKAIGWVLREVSKRRPELVFAFLRAHQQAMSGLTFREGSRQLPARLRAQLAGPPRPGAGKARLSRGSAPARG